MRVEVQEPSAIHLAKKERERTDIVWKRLPLGDVLIFQRGFDLPHRMRRSGPFPIVSSAGTTAFHDIANVLAPGVVTGRYGTIGQLFYLEEDFWPLNTTLYVRDFKGNDSKFVYYLLHSFDFGAFSGKSGVPGVNRNDLHAESVSIPVCVEEQRAIATALSDVDALIAGLERLIAKKRDIKQAAMQQLLTGQTRLPGFSGEWHQGVFGDVVSSLEAGVSVNSTDAEPTIDTPCVLKTSALVGGRFLPNEAKVIEPRDLGRARTSAKGDTILISRMNTPTLVGEVAYVAQDFDSLYLPDRVWMAQFNANKKTNVRWIAFVLSSQPYRDLLREVATGTSGSMKNISKSALCSLPIRFPSPEEQTAIATVLSDMDADLTALESRLAKTRAIKQGMMQELLTGRTRLV